MVVNTRVTSWRVTLGCVCCPLNSVEVRLEHDSYLAAVGEVAKGRLFGELVVAHNLNHSWSGLGGNHSSSYLSSIRSYVNCRREGCSPDSYVVPCLLSFESRLLEWRFPVQMSLLESYCVPLSVLSRTGQVTVVVSRLILMMIGHCFARASFSSDLLDSVVYSVPAGLRLE